MMKKAFYIGCHSDIWVPVAQKLQEEYNFETCYWCQHIDDSCKERINRLFPNAIFHEFYDAWKNIFCEEVEERSKKTYIDSDLIRNFAKEELIAIKMCDRLDHDRKSFNFMERQRHVRNYMRKWIALFDINKPDVVIATAAPHGIYDYVLYILCKHFNIPFVIFMHSSFDGRFMVVNDCKTIGDAFVNDFQTYLKFPELAPQIPQVILDRYKALQEDYDSGAPFFMATNAKGSKESSGVINLLKKFLKENRVENGRQSVWDVLLHGFNWNGKKCGVSLEKSRYSFIEYSYLKCCSNRYKRQMRAFYKSISEKPQFGEKYVFLGLHYQPEETSCPIGDIYVDQSLIVDELLANLPDDYYVYVKEHPHQYYFQMDGHTSRIKEFYEDLKSRPRIRLIDSGEPTYPLIQNSSAVATICGTIGWEAMVYHKPTIVFGLSWYENCPLVLNIKKGSDAKKIISYIENYTFDESVLMAYLSAFTQNSYYARYFKAGNSKTLDIDQDFSVSEIVRAIIEHC